MATNSRTHAARGSWPWVSRPVTCREFAAAMYCAGQTRAEVRERLEAMGRWSPVQVRETAYKVGQQMGLVFGYGGGPLVRQKSPSARAEAIAALKGHPEMRPTYHRLRAGGAGALDALRALGL